MTRTTLFALSAALLGLAAADAARLGAPRPRSSAADEQAAAEDPAVPEIDEVESAIQAMGRRDVRDALRKEESDLAGPAADAKEKRRKGKGLVQASDPASVKRVRHRADDGSPFLVEFEGPDLVRLELPVQEGDGTRKRRKKREARGEVTYYSLSAIPSVEDGPKASLLCIDGATIGFRHDSAIGPGRFLAVMALNGKARGAKRKDWLDTGVRIPLNERFEAQMPMELAVRVDRDAGEWDLYFMNSLALAGMHLGERAGGLWIKSAGQGRTALFHLLASEECPLFEDADRDGIDDAFEDELGFSPQENDRRQLDEEGAFSNLQHFVNARRRYISPAQREIRDTIYQAMLLDGAGGAEGEPALTEEELAKRRIPESLRNPRLTEAEIQRQTLQRQAALRNLGRPAAAGAGDADQKGGAK